MNESVHTDIDKWPMRINRTPVSTQYEQIGSQSQTQPIHLYTHLTTTLLYAGAHPGKKGYYQNLAVERQFMRREGYPANLGTPKIPMKNGVVVIDKHLDTIPDETMDKARQIMRSLAREEANTGKDYGRHIHTQSTRKNGNVIVRTEREEAHNGKRTTRRTLKQAYTPTIARPIPTETQQQAAKARIWADPYVMPLNAEAMRIIHGD